MKTIILAGGLGTRLGSVSETLPKPMLEIGGRPILWHIMKIYSSYGFNDFIICLGYKSNMIKDYFHNFNLHNSDFTVNLADSSFSFANPSSENWKVTLVDTGLDTLKGGRIKRVESYLEADTNMLTYGDGVSDIDINDLIQFHKSHGKIMTITGVRPPSMFGEVIEEGGKVVSFEEKPQISKGLINGGFMIFNRGLLDVLNQEKDCDLEFGAMEKLANEGQVMSYIHEGFWECADTVRDIEHLNKLWEIGNSPWKVW